MKAFQKSLGIVALVLFSWSVQAGPSCNAGITVRPLSDFLGQQGSTSNFFTPVPDYVGWTDNPLEEFALIDYAGIANKYLKDKGCANLDTKVVGNVRERKLHDGRAEITVKLQTSKALGFAQSAAELEANGFDFNATPTIFGNKTQDVCGGASAAIGSANLEATFTIAAPGADLPDLVDVIVFNPANYHPVIYKFQATIADGLDKLKVRQQGHTDKDGKLIFDQEVVEIK